MEIEIEGVRLSRGAAGLVELTGCSPGDDVRRLIRGDWTKDSLLAHCLDGAEAEYVDEWTEYVDAVVAAGLRLR
jgi:hypothetical protein